MSVIEIMFLTEYVKAKEAIGNREDCDSQKEQKLENAIHKTNLDKKNLNKYTDILNQMLVKYFNRIEECIPYYYEADVLIQ